MTARSFADTNIVVYTLDVDRKKQQKAISLMRATPVISVQVVNEFVSVALSKMKLPRPSRQIVIYSTPKISITDRSSRTG